MHFNVSSLRSRRIPALLTAFAIAASSVSAGAIQPVHADGEGPVITVQPQDVEVKYPEGASFHVEVANPEDVASYEWEVYDQNSTLKLTNGSTIHTDTLVFPSTAMDLPDLDCRCIITDKNGNQTVSEYGSLYITNKNEYKTVLYVGEYAVNPGETFDISETALGTGKVIFDKDGMNITLDNINIDTTNYVNDVLFANSLGLMLYRRHSIEQEYYFHLVGKNVIKNTFYDPEYNAAGIEFNSFFACAEDPNAPTIRIDGDGSLEMYGGSNIIYSDANIEIAAKVYGNSNSDIFSDGITCRTFILDEGGDLTLEVNGTAIFSHTDIRFLKGSKATITSRPARVSVGATTKNILYLPGSVYLNGAEVNIKGIADPERFLPYQRYLATFCGIAMENDGGVNLDNSKLTIDIEALPSEEQFAVNFNGLVGGEDGSYLNLTNDSVLLVNMNAPGVLGTAGIYLPGAITVEKDCGLTVNVLGSGEVFGIQCDKEFNVTDANVDVELKSDTDEAAYGIATGGTHIILSAPVYSVRSFAPNGVAFAADTGEREEEASSYVKDYKASFIQLGDKAAITHPKKSEISTCGIPGYGSFIKAEVVYDSEDTSKPAAEVIIGVPESGSMPILAIVGIAAAFILLAWLYISKRKKA